MFHPPKPEVVGSTPAVRTTPLYQNYHIPRCFFYEITDFLTNVFKAAAFSCVINILIVICVVLLVLKWTVFIDGKKKDSQENEVEN